MAEVFVSTGTGAGSATRIARELYDEGFTSLELSGGSYDEGYLQRVNELVDVGARISLHNYFPPPEDPFVLNLGHWDYVIREKSIQMVSQALRLSNEIGSERYAVHSPFAVDITPSQLGTKISSRESRPKRLVEEIFLDSLETLKKEANSLGVSMYIENSPLSSENLRSLGKDSLLGVTSEEVTSLAEKANVGVLCDLGHLKVSSNTLGLDIKKEADSMLGNSDYLHLSDNDAVNDQHRIFDKNAWFISPLLNHKGTIKTVALEVGLDDLESVRRTQQLVQMVLS